MWTVCAQPDGSMSSLLQSTGSSPYVLVHIVGPLAATVWSLAKERRISLRLVRFFWKTERNKTSTKKGILFKIEWFWNKWFRLWAYSKSLESFWNENFSWISWSVSQNRCSSPGRCLWKFQRCLYGKLWARPLLVLHRAWTWLGCMSQEDGS